MDARTLCLLPRRTERERKLYLWALLMNGELPDIITAESESGWYGERSLVCPSSSPSSVTSLTSSSTWTKNNHSVCFCCFVLVIAFNQFQKSQLPRCSDSHKCLLWFFFHFKLPRDQFLSPNRLRLISEKIHRTQSLSHFCFWKRQQPTFPPDIRKSLIEKGRMKNVPLLPTWIIPTVLEAVDQAILLICSAGAILTL